MTLRSLAYGRWPSTRALQQLALRRGVCPSSNISAFVSIRLCGSKSRYVRDNDSVAVAPEVLRGEEHDPFKADVWAFGVVMWEIATRLKPHENLNPYAITYQVCRYNLQSCLDPNAVIILIDLLLIRQF